MFNKDYNIAEYAINNKKNRHHFHIVTDQDIYKPTDKDVIKSVYLHTTEITDYFKKNRWFGYYQKVGEDRGYWTLDEIINLTRKERDNKKLILNSVD